jgi:uncharacterized cupredoxin-like copper-binding protein
VRHDARGARAAPLAPVMKTLARCLLSAVLIATALAMPARSEARQTVTVEMTEYHFTPAKLVFRSGRDYRLLLVNRGRELHEFTAPGFLGAIVIDDPGVVTPGGREIAVAPGASRELIFRATHPGRYTLNCADHDWAGMVGEIVVE